MARFSLEKPEPTVEKSEPISLDGRLASILEAIEGEKIPERLLKLAEELQHELHLRKQRQNPH